MPTEPLEITTPPRAAASVILLRDVPGGGIEVFMLRRSARDKALAGAHVFPGGKVDADDNTPDRLTHLWQSRGLEALTKLPRRLAENGLGPFEAGAVFYAALRETFEECDVLLARDLGPERIAELAALAQAGASFVEVVDRHDLTLDLDALQPWSRWITPRMPSMIRGRFDTRFFVTRMPEGQSARGNVSESEVGEWFTPRAGLDRYWRGEITLAAPQIMTLVHLSRFWRVAEVLAAAAAAPPPLIEPLPIPWQDTRLFTYPGHPAHPMPEPLMPGPTALIWRNERLEPPDGFESLFA